MAWPRDPVTVVGGIGRAKQPPAGPTFRFHCGRMMERVGRTARCSCGKVRFL